MELGFQELLLIGAVLLVFFGPKKLPEIGASLGKAIREFRKVFKETASDTEQPGGEEDSPSTDSIEALKPHTKES